MRGGVTMRILRCLDCDTLTIERVMTLWPGGEWKEIVDWCPDCGRVYRPNEMHYPITWEEDEYDDDERPNLEVVP